MIWLGAKYGDLTDWVTQQWVRATGRRVLPEDHSWLDGPIANTKIIGSGYFQEYAQEHGLDTVEGVNCGLLNDFSALAGDSNDLDGVAPAVQDFYQNTSAYDLDAWSECHGLFRPFGLALAVLFSRRLQQLNIPLSPLDSSKGMSSSVLQMWSLARFYFTVHDRNGKLRASYVRAMQEKSPCIPPNFCGFGGNGFFVCIIG